MSARSTCARPFHTPLAGGLAAASDRSGGQTRRLNGSQDPVEISMLRIIRLAGLALAMACLLPWAGAQDKGKYAVKAVELAAPKELSESIRKLLRSEALEFSDSSGQVIAQIWLRKSLPTDATAEQI